MASPDHGSRVGTQFGPYELRSLIGAGGMGEVYRAYDTSKDRTVAVKLLRTELAANLAFQQRFRRECRMAARLQDPHVVPVHDFGEISGVLYIDMRLVDGGSLRDLLRELGTLEAPRAARIIAQVASALDAAHADGLVHRDVKPENILLTPDDFAYLVDFGIADGTDGSPAYVAPERLGGSRIGPPADIYSLTCVLYECLTGRPPFDDEDAREVLNAHMFAPPPRPSIMRRAINRDFDGIITRGMAKQPAARFASAGELASAAGEAALWDQPSVPVGPPLSQPSKTRPFEVVYPNPEDTGYSPYPPSAPVPVARPAASAGSESPAVSRVVLSGVTAVLAVVAAALAGVLAFSHHRPARTATAHVPSAAAPPTSTAARTPSLSRPVQGADNLGFVGHPARCNPGNPPAAVVRTAQSLAVVCQTQAGRFYYRGERIRDGANIEISNAVRASVGFDVTNPANGVRYEVRPQQLTIISGRHIDSAEPVLQYASAG